MREARRKFPTWREFAWIVTDALLSEGKIANRAKNCFMLNAKVSITDTEYKNTDAGDLLPNLLPLPMNYQLNDPLLPSSLQQIQPTNTKQPLLPGNRSIRRHNNFELTKKRLKKSRCECFFRTIVNHNVWHAHKLHIKRIIRIFHKQIGEQKEMVTNSKPDFNNIEKAS